MTMAETCEITIEGNVDGPTLVFIHGWPDRPVLWRKQVAALKDAYRCVLVTLPNFGEQKVKAGGFDFPELVSMLLRTIEDNRKAEEKVTLVTHDWGAYIGYLLEKTRPELISRMIAFDVGGHVERGGFKSTLFIIGYQWSLIAFWLLGGIIPPLGAWLTRTLAGVIGVHSSKRAVIRSRINYPYFFLWRGMIFPGWRKNLLGRYTPQCPVLYLFGKKKPVMFHSDRWLDIVEQTGGSWVGLEGAGHWLMETHADEVNELIRAYLQEL